MLQPVTYQDYLAALAENPYYKNRWGYYSEAIEQAMKSQPNSCLELGVWSFPLFKNSAIMGLTAALNRATVIHDAKTTPWPFKDKQFDMFMALQVWEHLEGRQKNAFDEVKRIAKRAVISVPLQWVCENKQDMHHGLTLETFDAWMPAEPLKVVIVPPWATKRAIYVFDFAA